MLESLKESSLVLTTHRIDEAEQLCHNIAIMINGRFVVYGTPSHLKEKYGYGYIIKLFLKGSETDLDLYM
jgi:ABC-type multidrug transport system ATPase subunit